SGDWSSDVCSSDLLERWLYSRDPSRRGQMKKLSIAGIIVLLALSLLASPAKLYAQSGTDPLSVANAYLAAVNAGDLNAVLATFADDGVETDLTPAPGDKGVVRGKDQLRASYTEFLQQHAHLD